MNFEWIGVPTSMGAYTEYSVISMGEQLSLDSTRSSDNQPDPEFETVEAILGTTGYARTPDFSASLWSQPHQGSAWDIGVMEFVATQPMTMTSRWSDELPAKLPDYLAITRAIVNGY